MTCLVVRSRNFSDPTPFQIIICVFHSFGKKWEESRIKKLHLFRDLFCSNQTTRNFKIHFHSLKLDGSRVIPTGIRSIQAKPLIIKNRPPDLVGSQFFVLMALRETMAFFVSDPCMTGWWQLKYFWNFQPEPWGNDQIWLSYFSDGLKPPTRWCITYMYTTPETCSLRHFSRWLHFMSFPKLGQKACFQVRTVSFREGQLIFWYGSFRR